MVITKAYHVVSEMLGATNYWVDKKGKAHMVFHSHAEFAEKMSGIRFLHFGSDDNRGWQEQGKAYAWMFERGWMRASIYGPEKRVQVDFRGAMSKPQLEWAADEAFDRKGVVVTDEGDPILDFREEANESVASLLVGKLIGEAGPACSLGPGPRATSCRRTSRPRP
jgi:hypothetical protein